MRGGLVVKHYRLLSAGQELCAGYGRPMVERPHGAVVYSTQVTDDQMFFYAAQ
jgi:hypothetical protein